MYDVLRSIGRNVPPLPFYLENLCREDKSSPGNYASLRLTNYPLRVNSRRTTVKSNVVSKVCKFIQFLTGSIIGIIMSKFLL